MSGVVAALGPVFLLVLLGAMVRRNRWIDEGFWAPAEKLTYYMLFPALLVSGLGRAEIGGLSVLPLALALCSAVLLVTAGLLVLRRTLSVDGPGFTAVVQGAIRPNAYVALGVAGAVYQNPGITLTAIAIAVVVPLVNVISVAVLGRHGAGGEPPSLARVARQVARNPLVASCLFGVAINLGGGLPPVIRPLLEIMGAASLPLGLLAVGAGLDIAAARAAGTAVLGTSFLKLVALPALTALTCWAFGVHGMTAATAILFSALPCAPSAYVMTRQMGGDHRLMAAILTVETLLAAVTLPILILALRG